MIISLSLFGGIIGDTVKGATKGAVVYGAKKGFDYYKKSKAKNGRTGKQKRLKEIMNNNKEASKFRGWIKQEVNQIKRGKRKNIRNPIGYDLAHKRGKEARKGYGYEHSNLLDKKLHKLQHKFDNFGKKR